MDIYLTNNTFFDAKASYTTTVYANTLTVFVYEITSQTNKRSALIGLTNQQVVANTVCWFIEHPVFLFYSSLIELIVDIDSRPD
jgi:hypothetical protein